MEYELEGVEGRGWQEQDGFLIDCSGILVFILAKGVVVCFLLLGFCTTVGFSFSFSAIVCLYNHFVLV